MKKEFKRYRLEQFRTLTGFLELAAGLGILVGLYQPFIYLISVLGLSLLMFLGIIIRLRIKDPWLEIIPAIFYFFLNGYLTYRYLIIS